MQEKYKQMSWWRETWWKKGWQQLWGAAPYGHLSCLGRSSVKLRLKNKQTNRPPSKNYSINTLSWKHIYSLCTHIALHCLFRNHTGGQARKSTRSRVKEEVSDSRRRKARGKQYGNGHVGLDTSDFVHARLSSTSTSRRQWTAKTNHWLTSTQTTHSISIWCSEVMCWTGEAYLSECLGSSVYEWPYPWVLPLRQVWIICITRRVPSLIFPEDVMLSGNVPVAHRCCWC